MVNILQVCRVPKLAGVSLLVATTIFFYKVEKLSGMGEHFFFSYSVLVCPIPTPLPSFSPAKSEPLSFNGFFFPSEVYSPLCVMKYYMLAKKKDTTFMHGYTDS